MDYDILGRVLVFTFCCGFAWWYFSGDDAFKKSFTAKIDSLLLRFKESDRKIASLEESVSYLRGAISSQKQEIDAAQDHCARIWDQTQIINKRQKILKEKMIPTKYDITVTTTQTKQKRALQ